MNAIRTLALSLAVVLSSSVSARSLQLAAPTASDVQPSILTHSASTSAKANRLETAPVQFAWVLPDEQSLSEATPYRAQSREFWTRVSAAELQTGKRLQTSAPEALIRLSPIGQAKAAVDPLQVEIQSKAGTFARGLGMKNAANSAELKAAGATFPEGTLAFQLDSAVGQGALQLRVAKAAQDYLLHVYEPNSQETLSLSTDRITAVHGQTFTVRAQLNAGDKAEAIGGFLSAPNGFELPLQFERQGDAYVAKVTHDGLAGEGEGLWEVHTFSSHLGIQRDAKTAVVSSVPRARLQGSAESTVSRRGAIRITVPVTVAASSRYELRGALLGHDGGLTRAGAMASTAAILAPGQQSLTLIFDAETVAKSGLQAPYQISNLTLLDQATLAVQESRAAAVDL